jgi:hypothetical protein
MSYIFLQSWELILDAGSAIKNVIDAKKVKIHEFFADVLGSDWASFLPNLFTSQSKYLFISYKLLSLSFPSL